MAAKVQSYSLALESCGPDLKSHPWLTGYVALEKPSKTCDTQFIHQYNGGIGTSYMLWGLNDICVALSPELGIKLKTVINNEQNKPS